ncbi:MAG: helix-turn-helix transcriptional regulator [Candidatus Liberibacter asiaticus]|nr:helix-turn-helix transcriptional regulator [Candidatus Liberibacter asiaticus]
MRIRDIRKTKGKTLDEMAKEAKQTESAVWQFENGIRSTSINYALFLRNEFGVSFDWIYDGETIIKAHKPKASRCNVLDPITIGLRLKEIREQLGLNRIEFGRAIGVTCTAISNFERGNRTPRITTAQNIKRVIGKPLDWIYFGDEIIVPKSTKRAKANQSSRKGKKVLKD